MLRLENIKIREDLDEEEVAKIACKNYKLDYSKVQKFIIYKKSIDARNKEDVHYNYTIDIDYLGNKIPQNIKVVPEENFELNIDVKRAKNKRLTFYIFAIECI